MINILTHSASHRKITVNFIESKKEATVMADLLTKLEKKLQRIAAGNAQKPCPTLRGSHAS